MLINTIAPIRGKLVAIDVAYPLSTQVGDVFPDLKAIGYRDSGVVRYR